MARLACAADCGRIGVSDLPNRARWSWPAAKALACAALGGARGSAPFPSPRREILSEAPARARRSASPPTRAARPPRLERRRRRAARASEARAFALARPSSTRLHRCASSVDAVSGSDRVRQVRQQGHLASPPRLSASPVSFEFRKGTCARFSSNATTSPSALRLLFVPPPSVGHRRLPIGTRARSRPSPRVQAAAPRRSDARLDGHRHHGWLRLGAR